MRADFKTMGIIPMDRIADHVVERLSLQRWVLCAAGPIDVVR